MTNTLAYYFTEVITVVKSVIKRASAVIVVKHSSSFLTTEQRQARVSVHGPRMRSSLGVKKIRRVAFKAFNYGIDFEKRMLSILTL